MPLVPLLAGMEADGVAVRMRVRRVWRVPVYGRVWHWHAGTCRAAPPARTQLGPLAPSCRALRAHD
jgi:hypothetical protein